MSTQAQRKKIGIGKKEESDFTPLQPDYYTARFVSYEVREHKGDPQARFEKQKKDWMDVQVQWEVQLPEDDPVERRSWPKIPKGVDHRSELLIMFAALRVRTMAEMLEDGIDDVYDILDECVGKRCRLNIVAHEKQDGSASDKIDGYVAITSKGSQAQPSKPAKPPVPMFGEDEDEGDIPF